MKGWLSKVMYKKEFKPKKIENATILAFDMEDYGVEKVREFEGRKTITYRERVPLGITLAYEDKNREIHVWKMQMYGRKWSLFDLTRWIVDCLWWRETTEGKVLRIRPFKNTIYLVSHFSVAEFRHISDWARRGKKSPFVGKGNIMHFRDSLQIGMEEYTIRVIDSFAYFMKGLGKIAAFIGEEKRNLDDIDGKNHGYWIEHMDELLEEYPDKFWWYAEHDSRVLVKAWNRWREFFLETFDQEILNDWTPTIASVAASLLRTDYIDGPIMPHGIRYEAKEVHWKEDKWRRVKKGGKIVEFRPNLKLGATVGLRHLAMLSYWGGRREAFYRGILRKPLTILDFKSHYNRCGQTQPLPLAETKWDWFSETSDLPEILKREGYVEAEFCFPKGFKYPCLPIKSSKSGRLLFPRMTEHFGEKNPELAWFTIFELRIAFHICPELKIIIHRTVGFLPTEREINNPVRRFLRVLEDLKTKAQREKGKSSLEYHATKLMGNALVGKFMQRVEDWKFEDTLDLYQSLGWDLTKTSSALHKNRPKMSQEVGSTWSPEWGSLILGRARGLLGLGFHMVDAITGHTDSMVLEYDEEKIRRTIETMKGYESILEVEQDAETEQTMIFDAFWIGRSAYYVYFKESKAIKSVHHGYSCKDEIWGAMITKNLENQDSVEDEIHSWGIVKPKTTFDKGLPLGSDYLREGKVKWKWDFKRKLENYENSMDNIEGMDGKLLWTGWFPTEPYESADEAWEAETKYKHKKKGIKLRGKGWRTLPSGVIEKVVSLRRKGLTYDKITEATGVSKGMVSKICKGIKRGEGETSGKVHTITLSDNRGGVNKTSGVKRNQRLTAGEWTEIQEERKRLTDTEIAKRHRITTRAIRNRLGPRYAQDTLQDWEEDWEEVWSGKLVECSVCETFVYYTWIAVWSPETVCRACLEDMDWDEVPEGDWWEDDERFWMHIDEDEDKEYPF